jgi:hypothetical protein
MSDLKEESEALRRWTAIIPELQKLFRSGAKITVEVPKSITWPRSDASKEIEKISPEEFSKRIGKLAFTAGPQQVAATEPEYSLNGDRATVRMKKFLLDVTGLIQSTVIQYEMTWRQGKTWEIQELRQTVRSPDEAERKEIDAAIAKIKVPDTRIPR